MKRSTLLGLYLERNRWGRQGRVASFFFFFWFDVFPRRKVKNKIVLWSKSICLISDQDLEGTTYAHHTYTRTETPHAQTYTHIDIHTNMCVCGHTRAHADPAVSPIAVDYRQSNPTSRWRTKFATIAVNLLCESGKNDLRCVLDNSIYARQSRIGSTYLGLFRLRYKYACKKREPGGNQSELK